MRTTFTPKPDTLHPTRYSRHPLRRAIVLHVLAAAGSEGLAAIIVRHAPRDTRPVFASPARLRRGKRVYFARTTRGYSLSGGAVLSSRPASPGANWSQ